jgi:hypothetical protein
MGPLAERFNLIAGDNGLGKSFLLEVAWWALTRTWHETPAVPSAPAAEIGFAFDGASSLHEATATWNPAAQTWTRRQGKPPNPGLVLYLRVDGSFSVWDPLRNYRLYTNADGSQRETPASYQFSPTQVFRGLKRVAPGPGAEEEELCSGLLREWTEWQGSKEPEEARAFALLTLLLQQIGPEGEALTPGSPALSPNPNESRKVPTVRMPYGQDVPIVFAPAGVQRMAKFAYLLTWALIWHQRESVRTRREMTDQVIVLFDEPETHLHPRWQRTVLPSLEKAIASWREESTPRVQFLVATHSPLVLASMEPIFDTQRDALWKLDHVAGKVVLERDAWHRRGDASAWLTSDVFDLAEPGSLPAQQAITEALALLQEDEPASEHIAEVTEKLAAVLGDTDRFWLRWSAFAREQGVRV